MTTIAFKDGILATDSRATEGDMVWDNKTRKIFCHKGYVLSIAGSIDNEARFLKWFKDGADPKKRPCLGNDFAALVFTIKGRKIESYFGACLPHHRSSTAFVAEGSGAFGALCAMAAGASSKRAVKIVMKFNTASGGRVQTKKLWNARKRKCKTTK